MKQHITENIILPSVEGTAQILPHNFFADLGGRSVIGYRHHNVVCLSARPSVTPCIVALGVGVKRLKYRIAVNGTPFQRYGVSLAIWDHTVLPATRHK